MRHWMTLLFLCLAQVAAMAADYHGTVTIGKDKKTLQDATVQFFDRQVFIGGAKTGIDGSFSVSTPKKATRVSISYVGMDTYVREDSLGLPCNLGSVNLQSQGVALGEVTVKGSLRRQNYDKDIYLITDSLRKGTHSGAQLLEKIPGVLRDWENDNLRVNGLKDIVVVVNQVERGMGYAMRINPKRIKQVEITYNPTGKYEGRQVLVNIVLYDDYKGWDFAPYANMQYGRNGMNSEEVGGSYTYSIDRVSVNLSSSLLNNTRKECYDFSRSYGNSFEKKSVAMDLDSPNSYANKLSYDLSAGVEYKLSSDHSLSARANGSFAQSLDSTLYQISEKTSQELLEYMQYNKDRYYSNDYNVGLFYRGKIGGLVSISSDLTYDYYTVKERRTYFERETASSQATLGDKRHVYYDIGLSVPVCKSLNFDFDYNIAWRRYKDSMRDTGSDSYRSRNTRHFLVSVLSWHPLQAFSISGGAIWMGSSDANSNGHTSSYSWSPMARLFFKPCGKVTVRANFHISAMYPNLDRLSSTEYQVDSWMVHSGNPQLRPAVMNYLYGMASIDGLFTMHVVNFYQKDMNDMPYYSQLSNGMVRESYVNVDWHRFAVGLSGDYKLMKNFYLGGSLWYTHDAVSSPEIVKKAGEIYELDLNARYMLEPAKLNFQASYEFKHAKTPTIQGKFEARQDAAKLVLVRSFMKGRLEASLTGKVPVNIFSRKFVSETKLPFFSNVSHESSNSHYGPYLSLSAKLYLHGGKQVRMNHNSFNIDREK